jgi:hypothetical protein
MWILSVLIAIAAAGLAQEQPKPHSAAPQAPAKVDKALRGRVQIFFQALVDGKSRVADQVVAQDSRNFFFDMQKPHFRSCEIEKLEFSQKFTRAEATVNCDETVTMGVVGAMNIKMPRVSTWKLEHGKWCWYVDPEALRKTPFGPMIAAPPTSSGNKPSTSFPRPQGPKPEELAGNVWADKHEVDLSGAQPSSYTVTITNETPGWITLVPQPVAIPGLEIKLDRKELGAKGQGRLTFTYQPSDPPPPAFMILNVMVDPIGRPIQVRINFRAAAGGDKPSK